MGLHEQFRDLVDLHYGSVWACVSVLTARSADTEDLVHEAFLLAFDRLSNGGAFSGDPGKWLRGTARHLVFAWWRQKRRLPEVLARHLEALATQDEDPLDGVCRTEVAAALHDCLGKLPGGDRELIRQRYEAGKDTARTAADMELNSVTLHTRLYRVRQAPRRCMDAALGGGIPHGT